MTEKKLPIGIDDFKKLRTENYYYIDKSLLIKEIIDEPAEVVLLPRPRRFGKTLNLSMLRYFFEPGKTENSNLFTDLKIAEAGEKYWAQQGEFPVIQLDFKGTKSRNWESCRERIKRTIANEYERHHYLLASDIFLEHECEEYNQIMALEADQTTYEFALENLADYLARYHQKKVVILIDEYDEPIQSGYLNGFYEEIIDFMRGLLTRALKGNSQLKQGVLSGILRIAKESIFSGLNNLLVSTLIDSRYDKYFGLLESEVKEICDSYNLRDQFKKVRDWYNGYSFGEQTIYNPWSILNFIYSSGQLEPYWVNTSGNELIKRTIIEGSSQLKSDLEVLIAGNSVEKKIDKDIVFSDLDDSSEAVWSFLLFSGYLTAENQKRKGGQLYCQLEIPNLEIQYIYEEIILDWLEENITSSELELMLTSLVNGEIETFAAIFQEFVINSMSNFDTGGEEPEKTYHAFVLGLLLNLRDDYQVKSNRESGYGRYDVMIIPDDKEKLGIVMEFKRVNKYKQETLEEAVAAALNQIKERKYKQELVSWGVENILELGIGFAGKNVLVKTRNN